MNQLLCMKEGKTTTYRPGEQMMKMNCLKLRTINVRHSRQFISVPL